MAPRRLVDNLLPDCEGPKLHAFDDRSSPVNFIRSLGEPSDGSIIGQSHVFEVSISSKTYAMKIFKFYDIQDDYEALIFSMPDRYSIDLVRAHRDPFFSECGAYGRLIDENLNGKVAVRCYGYMMLPADQEERLSRDFHIDDWDRPESEYTKNVDRQQPFRAIIKDLVTQDVEFDTKTANRILRDLKRMRRARVFAMDVQARNYKGGLLLDFSVAITEPHYLFETKPIWRIEIYKDSDLVAWQDMVDEAGVVTSKRAVRNDAYCRKLRPRRSRDN